MTSVDEKDVFNILVATDNHIGYMEKDPVRGGDSLNTFKEILGIAKNKKVDFLLLGGDLFHDNKPSRHVLYRTMELLRQFCMGSRPCPIEFRSDPSVNFCSSFPCVNYEDPNYNIDIPVFSIHGNHDDPTGERSLSAMDILSISNLINYFGKAQNVEDITISPILMQKGSTKLALYGLGSIRDERLARMFKYNKVKFLRPKEDRGRWFNLLVLHQNRAQHSCKNFIPPSLLPSFFDLVIWGHEHECIPEAEYESNTHSNTDGTMISEDSEDQGFYIYQPGSSVATSLSEGEVAKKHVGVLYIKGTDFRLDQIPLKTVRPFVYEQIFLSKTNIDPLDTPALQSYLQDQVEDLIRGTAIENPDMAPLIRLKVDYSGDYSIIPPSRFGQNFINRVANHGTILHWTKKKRATSLGGSKKGDNSDEDDDDNDLRDFDEADEQQRVSTITSLLEDQLKKEHLNILSEKRLVEAVQEYVEKSEKDAISEFVKFSLDKTQQFLKDEDFPDHQMKDKILEERETIMKIQEDNSEEIRQRMPSLRSTNPRRFSDESDDDIMDTTTTSTAATTRSTGTTRGRGGRGRGRGRGRGAKKSTTTSSSSRHSQLPPPSSSIPPAATSTPLVTLATTTRRSTKSKKATPKISYMISDDNDDDDFDRSRMTSQSRRYSSDESSDDPFAAPASKKRKS